jgi:hypothetical protein
VRDWEGWMPMHSSSGCCTSVSPAGHSGKPPLTWLTTSSPTPSCHGLPIGPS